MLVQKDKLDILEYLTSHTTAFVFLFLQYDIQLKHHHILLLQPSSCWVELKWNNRIRLKPFYDTTTFMDYYSKFRLWEGRMRTKRIDLHKIIDLKLEQLDNWNETGWTFNELSFTAQLYSLFTYHFLQILFNFHSQIQ